MAASLVWKNVTTAVKSSTAKAHIGRNLERNKRITGDKQGSSLPRVYTNAFFNFTATGKERFFIIETPKTLALKILTHSGFSRCQSAKALYSAAEAGRCKDALKVTKDRAATNPRSLPTMLRIRSIVWKIN